MPGGTRDLLLLAIVAAVTARGAGVHLRDAGLRAQDSVLNSSTAVPGEPMWPLFPDSGIPHGNMSQVGPEAYVWADPTTGVAPKCRVHPTISHRIWNVSQPALAPYLVAKDHPNFKDAAIVIIPGGGGSYLAWDTEGTTTAEWLNSIGISAFVLKYRVPYDKVANEAGLMDAQRAMSIVRHRADELGLNKSRIGVMGFSFGSGLAAKLSDTATRSYPEVDPVDRERFLPDFQLLLYGSGNFVSHRPPPTFAAIAVDDPCAGTEQFAYYVQAVKSSGQLLETHVYPNGGHGVGTCALTTNEWSGTALCSWTKEAEVFLRRHVLRLSTNSIRDAIRRKLSGDSFTQVEWR